MRDQRLARPRPLPSSRKPLGIVPSAFCPCLVSLFIRLGSPRSGRQSGRNRSSYSPKPITRGTQTLHKGRSEIAQGELKPLTRGANQIHNRRSDGKPVLPAAPFRRSDRKIRPTRTIHFVLPTLSFRATDFLTIPTDFFFSAYGVIRTNHTAPDPPDFRIFAAPPRSAAHSPRQGRSVPISKTFQGHSNTDTISSKPQRDFIEGRLDFIGTPLGLLLSLEPPRAPLASSDAPGWICQSPRLHFQKAEVGFDRASGWISRTLRLDFTGTAIGVNPSPRQG